MKTYPKIWFLRHGQTEWNREYRLQGRLNSDLTEQGIAEAHRQAALLEPVLNTGPMLFASPLGRARQTADIALHGKAYICDDRLMEIDAGAWQGRSRDDIMAADPNWAATNPSPLEIYSRAEKGEGLSAFWTRIVSFLDDLTGPSVIVAHGLLGQILRAEVCGIEVAKAATLSNRQGCIYQLEDGRETIIDTPQVS